MISLALSDVPGIERLQADYLRRELQVELDPQLISREDVAGHLQRIGFPAKNFRQTVEPPEPDRWARFRHAAVPVSATVLLLAMAGRLLDSAASTPVWLATFATGLASLPVIHAAVRALRLRRIDMNCLMVIAGAGALTVGEHFEAATAMVLFGVSNWLESFSVARARRAVTTLVELMPALAHRVQRGEKADSNNLVVEDVELAQLRIGDTVLVRPGERIPVDAGVEQGESHVNEAPLTGESRPVEKSPGQVVYAGSLNGEGALFLTVTKTADDSTLVQVARLVEQARAERSPTERFVDRFARWYTPAIIGMAAFVGLVVPVALTVSGDGILSDHFVEWFHRGLVLLVIACPCALVISTPITIVCGLHRATQLGMLIKGGEHLENAGRIDCLLLDKTGTVTQGKMSVTDIRVSASATREELLSCAAALEGHSEHPLATAIVAAANVSPDEVSTVAVDVSAQRGWGVTGIWNGVLAAVGKIEMFRARSMPIDEELFAACQSGQPGSVVYVGTKEKMLGVLVVTDPLREEAPAAIQELRRMGVRSVGMLTGDRQLEADRVAQLLHLDAAVGDLLPADKIARVKAAKKTAAHLAMVGDGVNDAPALAAADIGIAIGSDASDLALESADVVIMSANLMRLADLMRLGRQTRRRLWQNIGFAIAVKAVVLLLALAGLASLWMAVAADVGASLVVVFNGMRLVVGQDQSTP